MRKHKTVLTFCALILNTLAQEYSIPAQFISIPDCKSCQNAIETRLANMDAEEKRLIKEKEKMRLHLEDEKQKLQEKALKIEELESERKKQEKEMQSIRMEITDKIRMQQALEEKVQIKKEKILREQQKRELLIKKEQDQQALLLEYEKQEQKLLEQERELEIAKQNLLKRKKEMEELRKGEENQGSFHSIEDVLNNYAAEEKEANEQLAQEILQLQKTKGNAVEGLQFHDIGKVFVPFAITTRKGQVYGTNLEAGGTLIIVDAKSATSLLFNQKNDDLIILHLPTREVINLENASEKLNINFKKFSRISLAKLWNRTLDYAEATSFNFASPETKNKVADYLRTLNPQLNSVIGSASSLHVFERLTEEAVDTIKSGITSMIEAARAPVDGGIDMFFSIAKGMRNSLKSLGITKSELRENNVVFKLSLLQNLAGGVPRLIYMIRTLKQHNVDVSRIAKTIGTYPLAFLVYIGRIAGEADPAAILLNLHEAVARKDANLINSNATNALVDNLIQYTISNIEHGISVVTSSDFKKSLSTLKETLSDMGVECACDVSSLDVEGINIASILDNLALVESEKPLDFVVKVLSSMDKGIDLRTSLVALFLRLILLTFSGGIESATKLVPELSPFKRDINTNINHFSRSLIRNVISSDKDVYSALNTVPFFATLTTALENSLAKSDSNIKLSTAFQKQNPDFFLSELVKTINGAISGKQHTTIGEEKWCYVCDKYSGQPLTSYYKNQSSRKSSSSSNRSKSSSSSSTQVNNGNGGKRKSVKKKKQSKSSKRHTTTTKKESTEEITEKQKSGNYKIIVRVNPANH